MKKALRKLKKDKSNLLFILLVLALIIFITSLSFLLLFFRDFTKHMRDLTESEKQEITSILSQTVDLSNAKINFGQAVLEKQGELAQVEIIKDGTKKFYLVDLKTKKLVRT